MTPKKPSLVVIAADQKEYIPLSAAVYGDDNGTIMTEWVLSAEELSALMEGGHLRLWTWTFNQPLQPQMFQVVTAEGHPIREPYTGPERRVSQVERRRMICYEGEERRWAQRRRS